jgi:hypothetical protein
LKETPLQVRITWPQVAIKDEMLRKLTLSVIFLTIGALAASASDPGSVRFALRTGSGFDGYTNNPSASTISWLNNKLWRMQVSSPYFDSRLSWMPNAWAYEDLYGVPTYSPIVSQHPDWILKDNNGNMLYVPFACWGGGCSQYAADPGNAGFRNWWIQNVGNQVNAGYKGIWIDDVNMEYMVSDGTGNKVAPYDPRTGGTMSYDGWRNYIAGFTQQIRSAFPNKEITHNVIWFSDNNNWSDSAITNQIRSADYIVLERGISDGGLTGDGGRWSVSAFLSFIDYVHSQGKGAIYDELGFDGEYPLAGYFLTSNGNDAFGNNQVTPDNWWSGYDVHLGSPLGGRYTWNGLLRRDFSNGMVLLNMPGHPWTNVNLPGPYQRIDGSTVSSIGLGGRQGAVLMTSGSNSNPPPSTSGQSVSINCAGPSVGNFSGDQYVSGGFTTTFSQNVDLNGVNNAAPEAVYQSKRTGGGGGFSYSVPGFNAGQTYNVRLHFADNLIFWPGGRVFNVSINGNAVLNNFDIFVAAGYQPLKAVVKDVQGTADGNGRINIQFTPLNGNALVSGIEILP